MLGLWERTPVCSVVRGRSGCLLTYSGPAAAPSGCGGARGFNGGIEQGTGFGAVMAGRSGEIAGPRGDVAGVGCQQTPEWWAGRGRSGSSLRL